MRMKLDITHGMYVLLLVTALTAGLLAVRSQDSATVQIPPADVAGFKEFLNRVQEYVR